MNHRVLLADDDRAIRESLERALELEGYAVTAVADGVLALSAVRREVPDLVILDVMMPGVDGLGVCRVIRSEGLTVPILMLTARVELDARVAGLDAGADDYLAKPFELDELLARLRALLRRVPAEPPAIDAPLIAGGLRIDAGSRRVWWLDRQLDLSKTEFDLLELLGRNAGIVLTHSAIYDRIWGYDFGPDSKNLAVYISYLRRKFELAGAPALIRTVRGGGLQPGRPGRPMTLRRKFVAAFALIAAIVAGVIGAVAYSTTEHALHNEINVSLATAAATLADGGSLTNLSLAGTDGPGGGHHDGQDTIVETAQSVSVSGVVTHLSGVTVTLPVSEPGPGRGGRIRDGGPSRRPGHGGRNDLSGADPVTGWAEGRGAGRPRPWTRRPGSCVIWRSSRRRSDSECSYSPRPADGGWPAASPVA